MKIDVPVDPNDIEEKKADSRGRVSLGPEYADKRVLVTVLDSEEGIDYEAAEDMAAGAVELIERADDFDEMYRLMQNGEFEKAYAMMDLSPEEAEEKARKWREGVLGADQ